MLHPFTPNACRQLTDCLTVLSVSAVSRPLGRTAIGAELRNEDLVSGNLGEPLFRTHHISGTDRDYTLGINRTNISAHLEHNVLLRRLTVSVGFVAAKSSWSDMNLTLYPGIDLSYNIPLNNNNNAQPKSVKSAKSVVEKKYLCTNHCS